ncbi:lytic polysaccharide monooxygenase [Kibdelosporangium philippinense]|uniref:Lytic polysaccharide monooxygenase n=1 Tax=Kibdelosporangium philippinense TaxID=211113 RepID=A0ABS8ZGS6_9PSEU|nr:lytic polysaccharide monooxygenase auxiliary activity family 9 protein [Kibdelosporangium philippinense]MCE7006667.1 lytic polysaccharide monooxygenase [Kibdelosporangium philippinense]
MKRKFIAAVVAVLLAPLLTVILPAGTASAHGWINSPASRQQQCRAGTVACGEIKYEPQSVEGPKGLRNCHGNVGRFAELNNDGKGWQVQNVSPNQTFTWTITARHRTSTWEYFIGGTRVWSKNDGGAQPGGTVTHNVNLGSARGRQKLLAIWNIADTANAFYVCIDVNIR